MREQELILYRDFEEGELLQDMVWLMEHFEDEYYNKEDKQALCYTNIHRLLEMAGHYGFSGNLWHCYLTNLLVNKENSYSKACEIRGDVPGTINQAVLHDIAIFKELFDYDFSPMKEVLKVPMLDLVLDYETNSQESKVYNTRICKRICELAKRFALDETAQQMKDTLTQFYKEYGVGKFGLHKSFRIVHDEGGVRIEPILNIAHVKLSDLVSDATKKIQVGEEIKKVIDVPGHTEEYVEMVDKVQKSVKYVTNPEMVKKAATAGKIARGTMYADGIVDVAENLRPTTSNVKDNKRRPRNYTFDDDVDDLLR